MLIKSRSPTYSRIALFAVVSDPIVLALNGDCTPVDNLPVDTALHLGSGPIIPPTQPTTSFLKI